ncbi:MAG: hypoxanthine phosphoribosyltransferase [Chloroflexi bacterium]|nr:hypoxanthine phosphoribosyltransferase [Chloroflexota bacterium]
MDVETAARRTALSAEFARQVAEGGEVLLPAEAIQARVRDLAAQISADYAGRRLLLVGVLKGALMFMADLARSVTIPVALDFLAVSSYGPTTTSSGVVRLIKDLDESIEDWDVLLVEDIVDTGLTLGYITALLRARGPRSLAVCALLRKQKSRRMEPELAYVGFDIADRFVVGYGLDANELYRNLPFVGVLHVRGARTN